LISGYADVTGKNSRDAKEKATDDPRRRHRQRPPAHRLRRVPENPGTPCGVPDRKPEWRPPQGAAYLSGTGDAAELCQARFRKPYRRIPERQVAVPGRPASGGCKAADRADLW